MKMLRINCMMLAVEGLGVIAYSIYLDQTLEPNTTLTFFWGQWQCTRDGGVTAVERIGEVMAILGACGYLAARFAGWLKGREAERARDEAYEASLRVSVNKMRPPGPPPMPVAESPAKVGRAGYAALATVALAGIAVLLALALGLASSPAGGPAPAATPPVTVAAPNVLPPIVVEPPPPEPPAPKVEPPPVEPPTPPKVEPPAPPEPQPWRVAWPGVEWTDGKETVAPDKSLCLWAEARFDADVVRQADFHELVRSVVAHTKPRYDFYHLRALNKRREPVYEGYADKSGKITIVNPNDR